MPRKQYSTEQIITKLRQAEVELGRGLKTPQVCNDLPPMVVPVLMRELDTFLRSQAQPA